jgi:putative oxidoreductase
MIPYRLAPQVYALMRIVLGVMFLTYGLQKFGMLGGLDGNGAAAPFLSWPYGIAAILELVLGLLIAIGLFTKPAAFVASGEMAAAYFMSHQPRGLLPIHNEGMPAVLFCFVFLYIAARGAGIWSADGAMSRSPRHHATV